jgi:GntR family transcriptional regulator, vanillate catabolism transcriptional regulator
MSSILHKSVSKKTPRGPETSEQGTSQTARATLALREMLVQGQFPPGERMREVPLAKQLGISRIPLRLVLERLAHEGFLEMRPTRGFIAQQFSIADIYDAIDLRGALEGMAARLAAERATAATDLSTLRSLHEEMATIVRRRKLTLDSVAEYIDRNSRFHAEVLALSGSTRLRRAMDQICSLPFASASAFLRRHYSAPESHELFLISVEHHRAIVEAITAREGARAENVAREHARVARRNLESAMEHQHLGEVVPGLKLIKL